jgi:hypothetical protein
MAKATHESKRTPLEFIPDTPRAARGLSTGQLIELFAYLASVREDLRTGRKDAATAQRFLVEQLRNFIARNVPIPVFVERDPKSGKLFFRSSPAARKRPLPRDPRSAAFNRAYHKALRDIGEHNDIDDWSELRALHAEQGKAVAQ